MREEKITKIEITTKTVLLVLGTLVLLYLFYVLREVFISLFVAFIFMSALKPLVDALEKKGVPRILAALGVIVVSLSVIVSAIFYALPPLIEQTKGFLIYASQQLFFAVQQIDTQITPRDLIPLQSLSQYIPNLTNTLTRTVISIFSNILGVVSLFFFTLYFLLGINNIKKSIAKFLTQSQTALLMDTLNNVEKKLGSWLRGEIVLMVIIGVLSYIGLRILNVNYALPLAVIAGFLEIFPIIGPTISAIPAFFVAASVSWILGAAVIALYIIIQQLENNLIVPFVMKRAVGISPLAVLISLVIGQKLAGVAGIILAVPVVATLIIVVQELARYRQENK